MQACSEPVVAGPDRADLSMLADELTARGYQATLVAEPGEQAYLHVCNPEAAVMAERISWQAGYFTWSWNQAVARRDEVTAAADSIARVLRVLDPGNTGG